MGKIIEIRQGKLEGVEGTYADVFKGIPYAKPPVGKLRFHPPMPAEAWQGVYQADTFSKICPQTGREEGSFYYKEFYHDPEFMPEQSEDCLYLNIWAPKEGKGPFPVAVWFHGGGFTGGFGSEMEFDGEAYAKRGIVLVTVNYRLGILGYFAHPELTERDGHSGNYGMLDQVASVDWVRENIAAFGGDPEQITIFGQSAGGISVRALVSSPLLKGKIKGAILQSCGGYKGPLAEGSTEEALKKGGVGFLKKQGMTLEDFYELPAENVILLTRNFLGAAYPYTHSFLSLSPVVDGYVLPKNCDEALEQGEMMPISYMIGCTKNDIKVSEAGVRNVAENAQYTSIQKWGELQESQGNPNYMYYFSRQLPGDNSGAFHSSELWYMFGTLDRCWRPFTEADKVLSEEMLDAWAAFIKTGNPGWARYTKENPYVMEFDVK